MALKQYFQSMVNIGQRWLKLFSDRIKGAVYVQNFFKVHLVSLIWLGKKSLFLSCFSYSNMAKNVLWRLSKIKTLEVREIPAPTITWKLEVGIVTVFSTVLTLSPTLWWFDYMWQVWFLAIKLHTSATGTSLSLLFFQPCVNRGQKWEQWEKARGWGAQAFPLTHRSQLVPLTFSAASCDQKPAAN